VFDITNAGPKQRFVVLGDEGPFIVHNCVQTLARSVIADAALKVSRTELGQMYPLALSVHDELVYVVREDHAQEMLDTVQTIMRTPPDWWPELVTWSEGDIADSYGEAK
jgi:DNA polymerase I-like protein with 3'-5' exonuclease and polymerase domains